MLDARYNSTVALKLRADDARDRARVLYQYYFRQLETLKRWLLVTSRFTVSVHTCNVLDIFVVYELDFQQNEENLRNLQEEVDRLTALVATYMVDLRAQAIYQAECSFGESANQP